MACISRDRRNSKCERYPLWLVVSWYLVHFHVVQGFILCGIWKPHRWSCKFVKCWNLYLTSLNWNIMIQKQRKIIFVMKVKAHRLVTRWLRKFQSDCKNFDDLTKPKIENSEAMLKAVKEAQARSFRRVTVELGISKFSVVRQSQNLDKRIWIWEILLHRTKILQNFWFSLVL